MSDAPFIPTNEDRVLAVAHALAQYDGHPPEGIRFGALVLEASRICIALAALAELEREAQRQAAATALKRQRRKHHHVEH